MTRRLWHLSALVLTLTLVFGCGRDRLAAPRHDGTVESPQASDRSAMTGQLRSVNPDKQAVIISVGDELYEFNYSDHTEVIGGTSNIQGLTGSTGNPITVHYRENPITSTKTVVRFELP